MTYRSLDAGKITETLARLAARIDARFPGASLGRVARDVAGIAEATSGRVAVLARPHLALRAALALTLLLGIVLIARIAIALSALKASDDLFSTMQGLDASVNLLIVLGAAVLFLVTAETRLKRRKALQALHEFRSIVHVIDMHQLTKDPSALDGPRTSASPERSMTPFELVRYLDYCSEMLSLTAKVAALYAQSIRDAVVVEAVSDIEQLTTNLAQKIWQKITILETSIHLVAGPDRAPTLPAPAVAAPPPASGPQRSEPTL